MERLYFIGHNFGGTGPAVVVNMRSAVNGPDLFTVLPEPLSVAVRNDVAVVADQPHFAFVPVAAGLNGKITAVKMQVFKGYPVDILPLVAFSQRLSDTAELPDIGNLV